MICAPFSLYEFSAHKMCVDVGDYGTCEQMHESRLLLQIVFWKKDEPDNKRMHTVSAGPFEPCPLTRGRTKRQAGQTVQGHVLNLWPYSDISAGVLVKNSKHSGELSDPPISFRTPEGGAC